MRQKQYRILDNSQESLKISKSIVIGKIKNQISFMQRIKRKNSYTDEIVEKAIQAIKMTLSNAENAENIEQLRGYEGLAARKYFEVFGTNIYPEWAEFKGRSKNPPRSNVNGVLSFLYTLLMYRIEGAIELEGLDCCVGNLHATNYGRNALVFDLMEEFRVPIVDSLCCTLFNVGTLKEEDFISIDFEKENYPEDIPLDFDGDMEKNKTLIGVLLTKDGIKKVIKAFEDKMDTLIMYQPTGQKISYKKIIYEQVSHYKRIITGEEKDYKAYYFK